MKKLLLVLVGMLPFFLQAQIGGRAVYDFLNLTPSARILSLGGVNVSTIDDDVHFATQNPALVNDSMHQRVGLSFSNYLSDIGFGYAGYSHTFDKIGSFHTGIQYVSYGKMIEADEYGNITGEFKANDFAWLIGYSNVYKELLYYGANLKIISSTLAPGFSSTGIALDLGAAYRSRNQLFSAGLSLKNIGLQLSTYAPGAEERKSSF